MVQKKANNIIRFIVGLTFLVSVVVAEPKWFTEENISSPSESYYIGYGWGKNSSEAKTMARIDIAQQIEVKVTAEDSFDYSSKGSSSFISTSKQRSDVELTSLDRLKVEYSLDLVYIALGYENLTFEQRIAKMLKKKPCLEEEQHKYLKHTTMFKRINALTHCLYDIRLGRKGNSWGLYYDDLFLRIPNKKNNDIYITTKSEIFFIEPSSYLLKDKEQFSFDIKSKASGYISIFDVYSNGIVTLIKSNIKLTENVSLKYPSEKSDTILYAALLENEKETFDLYVGVFSKDKLNLDQFALTTDTIENAQLSKNLDELMLLINDYEISTSLLRTRP